jgi:hypothetical protein
MMSASEITRWLGTLDPDTQVGVDESGLTLTTEDKSAYLEMGGLPDWDESDSGTQAASL